MRIFHICLICDRFDLGGAETHILTLAHALCKSGHHVTLLSSGGRLLSMLKGVRHIKLPLEKKRNMPFALFALWRIFRRERFDVIHAHTRYTAFLCRPFAKGRLVSTAHWVFDTAFPRRFLSFWGEETLAVSEDIRKYLIQSYRMEPSRITLTVNGIDTAHFSPAIKTGARKRIVYASRLTPDRAAAAFSLLDACAHLPADTFSLVLLGDGSCLPRLTEQARALQARDARLDITLVGGVADVAPYLREADIFVGVSRAALEGMAAGCAVILAGNEGYLSVFDPQNARAAEESNFCCRGAPAVSGERLVSDLSFLLSLSRDTLSQMGKENRLYVSNRYSEQRMASDALAVYERICKRKAVLCGYYGFHNTGDVLLCRALLLSLQTRGYKNVYLLSSGKISFAALRAIRQRYDFFLGGGNLLQDETSHRSLSFYLFFARRAKKRGGRLFLLSAGLGPLSPSGALRVCTLLSQADGVFCRTREDALRALALGGKHVYLTADAVLSLPFSPPKEKRTRILLSFRVPHENEIPAILAFALQLCCVFGTENILVFPMHPADLPFAKQLSSLTQIKLVQGSADDFLSILRECRCVFGTRLHLGICALAAHVPFYLGEGEEKCRFLIEDIRALRLPFHFCDTFSFSDRPKAIPSPEGMAEGLRILRERFERI